MRSILPMKSALLSADGPKLEHENFGVLFSERPIKALVVLRGGDKARFRVAQTIKKTVVAILPRPDAVLRFIHKADEHVFRLRCGAVTESK
jgi:hypothetical protein